MKIALRFSLLILAFLILQTTSAQEISIFTKYLAIGDNKVNRGVTVEELVNEGFIITGYTSSNGANEDVFLVKTDRVGNIIWSKTFGGDGKDNGWAVRQTNDEGYIISGFTDSFGAGALDVYLIKTNKNGDELWSKTFGGSEDEYGWDVRTTNDNGFIIAAQTNSIGKGEIDAHLIKTDSNGNELWSNTYGGNKVDRIFSVQQAKDGGYVSAGITYSYSNIDNNRDGYVLKTDKNGQQEWYKIIGEAGYDVAHAIAPTSDDGFIVTGYGDSYANSGGTDVYLVKVNQNGKIKWTKAFGQDSNERGIKGEQTKDGGYIAIGFTDKDRELYLLRTNSQGEELWVRTFGQEGHLFFGYTVKETRDGGFILTGHRENLSTRESNILLIKTNSNGQVEND